MINFKQYINEKLITFGNGRPEFNQVVIMAGGGGAGKGFVQKKLLGIEGKTFDVDAVKSLLLNSTKYAEKIKELYNIDIKKLNLKTDVDVSTLHKIEKDLNISDKRMKYFFDSVIQNPERKPNVIFDVTLKSIDKLEELVDSVITIGYKKEDIHIVWVINDLATAMEQNSERSRRVKDEILVTAHNGVSETISDIIKSGNIRKYMDGDFWFVFNKRFIDSLTHTSENGGSFVKSAAYLKVKEKNGNMMTIDDISSKSIKLFDIDKDNAYEVNVLDKIKDYVPDAGKWTNEGIFMADPGEPAKPLDKLITTFWKQNKWHKHGVFVHTLNVVLSAIISGDYRMIPAAFLHDIGKPGSATRDDGVFSYSFKDHEEASYDIIKNWSFISKYTKELVRWHYLLRGKYKAKEKFDKTGDEKYLKEYERQQAIWDSLDTSFQKELHKFLKHDDIGKDIENLIKKFS